MAKGVIKNRHEATIVQQKGEAEDVNKIVKDDKVDKRRLTEAENEVIVGINTSVEGVVVLFIKIEINGNSRNISS